MILKCALLGIILSISVQAVAATKVTGKISDIMLFTQNHENYDVSAKGLAVIYMEALTGACDSTYKRLAISTDHPLYETVYSMALAAKISDSEVELWHLSTCTLRSTAWDFSLMQLK